MGQVLLEANPPAEVALEVRATLRVLARLAHRHQGWVDRKRHGHHADEEQRGDGDVALAALARRARGPQQHAAAQQEPQALVQLKELRRTVEPIAERKWDWAYRDADDRVRRGQGVAIDVAGIVYRRVTHERTDVVARPIAKLISPPGAFDVFAIPQTIPPLERHAIRRTDLRAPPDGDTRVDRRHVHHRHDCDDRRTKRHPHARRPKPRAAQRRRGRDRVVHYLKQGNPNSSYVPVGFRRLSVRSQNTWSRGLPSWGTV